MTSNMRDREPRKTQITLKTAAYVTGVVLAVSGGIGMYEGIKDGAHARNQLEQTLPHPDTTQVTNAKAAMPFLESSDSEALRGAKSTAQSIIDQNNAFENALGETSLYRKGDRELYGGAGVLLAGAVTIAGTAARNLGRSNREWRKRLEAEESSY